MSSLHCSETNDQERNATVAGFGDPTLSLRSQSTNTRCDSHVSEHQDLSTKQSLASEAASSRELDGFFLVTPGQLGISASTGHVLETATPTRCWGVDNGKRTRPLMSRRCGSGSEEASPDDESYLWEADAEISSYNYMVQTEEESLPRMEPRSHFELLDGADFLPRATDHLLARSRTSGFLLQPRRTEQPFSQRDDPASQYVS